MQSRLDSTWAKSSYPFDKTRLAERIVRRDKPAEKEKMKELHVEGLATHDDPESCAVIREDGGEAFDRGTCGPGIEPRNQSPTAQVVGWPGCRGGR